MRQVAKKGLLTAVATGGVLAVTTGGLAYADSNAQGVAAGSPGVLSGNTVQAPIHVPINACGNTINVVGALNPAAGNTCVNASGGHGPEDAHGSGRGSGHGSSHDSGHGWSHGSGHGSGHGSSHDSGHGRSHGSGQGSGHEGSGKHRGSSAEAIAADSPGFASGNVVQAPVDVPVNACGNSVNVIAALNPAVGNTCANIEGPGHAHHPGHGPRGPEHPGQPHQPGQPHHPGKPHQPGQPQHPGQPHHPGKPHQPGQPQHPGQPHHPGKPSGGQPGKPGKPHHPVKPIGNMPANQSGPQLAHTGSENLGLTLMTGAGMLLGGAVLFRRSRKVRV